jgi:hypothetical protein
VTFRFGEIPARLLNVMRLSRQPLVLPIGHPLKRTVPINPGIPGTGQAGMTARSASVLAFIGRPLNNSPFTPVPTGVPFYDPTSRSAKAVFWSSPDGAFLLPYSFHRPRHVAVICFMLTASLPNFQDDRYAKAGQHSPQWLDSGLGKDSTKFPSNSPTKQVGNFGMLPIMSLSILSEQCATSL